MKRASKRRTNKEFLHLKNFRTEQHERKDIFTLIKEQLHADKKSTWYGGEMLYLMSTQKSSVGSFHYPNMKQQHLQTQKQKSEKYIAVMKKKDSPSNVLMARFTLTDGEVSSKAMFDLQSIRSIDYGGGGNELLFTLDSGSDHVFNLCSESERDESIWVIVQICKHFYNNEITLGYSIDTDALNFITNSSSILHRFPALQNVITISENSNENVFSNDEYEAETILDELNWDSSLSGKINLHQALTKKSEQLNTEIIDFLLQWEEMDDQPDQLSSKSQVFSSKGRSLSHTDGVSSPLSSVKDTGEVLNALAQVENELDTVDRWLGEQIEQLSEIQSNLHLIEAESGALETSWQNLNSLRAVISALVDKYSITEQHKDILLNPDTALADVFKLQNLPQLENTLKPLIGAIRTLRHALQLEFGEQTSGMALARWKQVQSISGVAKQKSYLARISDTFCSKFSDSLLSVFDWLLKHKSLIEGVGGKGHKITVKEFMFQTVLEDFQQSSLNSRTDNYVSSLSRMRSIQHNQMLLSQDVYHRALSAFLPLFDLFIELSPNNAEPLCEAYVQATQEKFYLPLIKTLLKDLNTLSGSPSKQTSVISLSTCKRYRVGSAQEVAMTFQNSGGKSSHSHHMSRWVAFKMVLFTLIPVMEEEEKFIQNLLRDNEEAEPGSRPQSLENFAGLDLKVVLHSLFGPILQKIDGFFLFPASTTGSSGHLDADGVEALAMLTVLTEFSEAYVLSLKRIKEKEKKKVKMISFKFEDNTTVQQESVELPEKELNPFIWEIFQSMRSTLLSRLNTFVSDQITWLNSQKGDPKSADVLLPFATFPSLIFQIQEMTNSMEFEYVNDLFLKLAKELFSWLKTVSKQSDKYSDKLLITNFTYFEATMKPLQLPILENFLAYAVQQKHDALKRYVNWMISYEFPALAALAVRMDGVGAGVNEEELSLYIRRKDVMNVIKELDVKTLDPAVHTMKKRLEKHFLSEFDKELHLVSFLWRIIRDRMMSILQRLEKAASASYQISLEVGPNVMKDLFDKLSNTVTSNTSSRGGD